MSHLAPEPADPRRCRPARCGRRTQVGARHLSPSSAGTTSSSAPSWASPSWSPTRSCTACAPDLRARARHRQPPADRGARRLAPSRPWPRFRRGRRRPQLLLTFGRGLSMVAMCAVAWGASHRAATARWCGSSRLPRCRGRLAAEPVIDSTVERDVPSPPATQAVAGPAARARRPPLLLARPGSTTSCVASCACCAVAHQDDYPLAGRPRRRCSPASSASSPTCLRRQAAPRQAGACHESTSSSRWCPRPRPISR